MKKGLLLVALCILAFSCSGRINDSLTDKKERKFRKAASVYIQSIDDYCKTQESLVNAVVKNMSLEEQVCQLFIENLEGDKAFVPVEKMNAFSGVSDGGAMIPGGYLFFSYNLANSPEEIMKFTDSIRAYCRKNDLVTPFLAIDQEGGFVNRLKIVAGPLPSCERISSNLDVGATYKYYKTQALQMKALGFDMNIAPVIEVCTPQNEKFLNGRSFGEAWKVRSYGTACVNAYENSGIATVVKHFPGNTNTDPHSGLPEIKLPLAELEAQIKPFYQVLHSEPAAVLMSHARTSSVDAGVPACFSEKWISSLKTKGEFEGIIFSDDIFMGALANNGFPPEVAAVKAVEAGVDCIMISEKRFIGPATVLVNKAREDAAFAEKIRKSCRKIVKFKLDKGILKVVVDKDGLPDVVAGDASGSIPERMDMFKKARQENIDMYLEYLD